MLRMGVVLETSAGSIRDDRPRELDGRCGRPPARRVQSFVMASPPQDAAKVFEEVRAHRLVAVIRAGRTDAALEAARAVIRGGIPLIEVTYSVPDAPAVIR